MLALTQIAWYPIGMNLKFIKIAESKDKTLAVFELIQVLNSLTVKSTLSIDLELANIDHTQTLDQVIHLAKDEAVKLLNNLKHVS